MMKQFLISFLISLLVGNAWQVHAQVNCSQNLIQAERAYYTGRFDEVVTLLERCLSNGFDKEQKTEAYRLIALSNIFSRNFEKADSAMLLMLQTNPQYEFTSQDPPEFKKRTEKFNIIPRYAINLMAGGIVPLINVTQVYRIRNIPTEATYTTNLGYQVGVSGSYAFTKNIFVEAGFEWQSFSFEVNKKNSLLETRMDEKQNRTQITLGLGYTYKLNRFKLQTAGGVSYSTLLSATANYYYIQQASSLGGVVFYREKLNFSNLDSRTRNDLRPFFMLRVVLPQQKSFGLSLLARYELGTKNYSAGRLDNLNDVLVLEKVEDDFKVSFFSFGIVAHKTFFKVK